MDLTGRRKQLNSLIINAICEADRKGAKVVSLGLLNQRRSGSGQLFQQKYPKLGVKLVDGTGLSAKSLPIVSPKAQIKLLLQEIFRRPGLNIQMCFILFAWRDDAFCSPKYQKMHLTGFYYPKLALQRCDSLEKFRCR